MRRFVFALATVLATTALGSPSFAAEAEPSAGEHSKGWSRFGTPEGVDSPGSQTLLARQVVHLLDYVRADYGASVSDGQVVSEKELAEQVEVLAEAGRIAAKLRAPRGAPDVEVEILRLKAMAEQHRPEGEVVAAADTARTELAAYFDVTESPRENPSRERGRQLYEQHCATCHGAEGRADTPRAAQYSPRPANFLAFEVARALSPARVFATTRFGVPKTAMVPFDFLADRERWDIAFYTSELDHTKPAATPRREARFFGLDDLASRSDDDVREDLRGAGIVDAEVEPSLAWLRTVAPYQAETLDPKGAARVVLRARASLKTVGALVARGNRDEARTRLLGTYLDHVEPLEAPLRGSDPALTRDIETHFKEIRADIDRGAPEPEIAHKLGALSTLLGRAGQTLEGGDGTTRSFSGTLLSSAGLALREGIEAALLIAALLAVVGRSGAAERKRWVHLGWTSAVIAGTLTWFATRRLVATSGLGREMLEGITALVAAAVLFYVSYWLFARREAARWMTYLRTKAGTGRAAFSLFGISFLAVYREAFETILFYQPIVAQPGAEVPAAAGAVVGGGALVALVVAYGRAGKFAPPRSVFTVSTVLLYALAVVFAGQGISALQTTGHLPLHPVALPHLPALGVYPTLETYGVQIALVTLALLAGWMVRFQRPPPGPPGNGIAGSREGAKL